MDENDDSEFEEFCRDLEGLKGKAPLFKPHKGLTEKIVQSIKQIARNPGSQQSDSAA